MKRIGVEKPTLKPEAARQTFERLALTRPDYAATPLNPYSLQEENGAYIRGAQQYVESILDTNLLALKQKPPKEVIDLLEVSVNSALFSRAAENQGKTIPVDCDDEAAKLFIKACQGFATPAELLALFVRYPQGLESIELAKQTHPFDWRATDDMDVAVDEALTEHSAFSLRGSERTQNVRYYLTRADNMTNPAAIILRRKADIASARLDDGSAIAVQRDSFVLDVTHPDLTRARGEILKNIACLQADADVDKGVLYQGAAVSDFINTQLTTNVERRSAAIYPGVRSYYVKSVL